MTYVSDRITIDERLCNGRPTIRGIGITVATVLEYLFAGDSREEILANHPVLEPEDIDACVEFALSVLNHSLTVRRLAT
ncbi:MAG: DUF433 domain-containing protein [Cytophagaceae bacterium]|nr:DUF433 domain-containing protein [Cytophagaceae bacterium]